MTVRVEGLNEFVRELKAADASTLARLGEAHKLLARLVALEAERRAPVGPTGRLKRSIRGRGSPRFAAVSGGGARIPYFGVQEFGGSVPKRGGAGAKASSGNRTRIKEYRGGAGRSTPWWDDEGAGYFFHPAARAMRQKILDAYDDVLKQVTNRAFPNPG